MQREMEESNYEQNYHQKKFFENSDEMNGYKLEKLRSNYTIYTFSVLNITGQVDFIQYTDELEPTGDLESALKKSEDYSSSTNKRPWSAGFPGFDEYNMDDLRKVLLKVSSIKDKPKNKTEPTLDEFTKEKEKLVNYPDNRNITVTIHTKSPNSALHTFTISPSLVITATNLYISSKHVGIKFNGKGK